MTNTKDMKEHSTAFGVASLSTGIASILTCVMPYVGFPLGILAIVFARKSDTGMATAGRITGIIGTVLNIMLGLIALFVLFVVYAVKG